MVDDVVENAPQQYSEPPATAHVWNLPKENDDTPAGKFTTERGRDTSVMLPSPTWPS
jgi:hypothetical protein